MRLRIKIIRGSDSIYLGMHRRCSLRGGGGVGK